MGWIKRILGIDEEPDDNTPLNIDLLARRNRQLDQQITTLQAENSRLRAEKVYLQRKLGVVQREMERRGIK